MPKKQYTRIAIAYDFDGTLAKGNIQENSFIPDLGISKKEFWNEVAEFAKEHEMDGILAYMYMLLSKAKATETVKIDKKSLREHGKKVKYYKGVETYFKRINAYAKSKGILIDHYIVSSGTKEMIEGTSIAKYFKYIFASSFMYDQHNVASWPALAINYTTKTQYLFRINKGITNAWDDSKINVHIPYEERPMPFKNMIYIGDGLTDVPAMKMLIYQGGIAVAVYDDKNPRSKKIAHELIDQDRASFIAKADYSEKGEAFNVVKHLVDLISSRVSLEKYK